MDRLQLPEDELRRTARQMNLPGFGLEQQTALHRAHVLVIGAGGLGCPITQTLAATGVGRISLIDDDTVNITNIHRQILFGASDVGRKKVEVAAERLRELQPGIEVTAVDGRMDSGNAVELLEGIDVLIDGSDTFATKFLAADAAEITGTPLVWGSVLRYRGDVALWWSGEPATGAPSDGVGLRDLYPDQPDSDSVPDCATAGVLGVTTSVVGGLMATETIKFLTGIGESVPGRLHMYDALTAQIRTFAVSRDPGRPLVTGFGRYGAEACGVTSTSSEAERLLARLDSDGAVAIDVREIHEKVLSDLPLARPGYHLPTSEIELHPELGAKLVAELPENSEAVIYCASGIRSQWFVDTFQPLADARGITLTNFPGGVNGLQ